MSRVVSETIDLSATGVGEMNKYITNISDVGIKVHPKNWTTNSNYLQVDGNGVYIKNSNNIGLASFTANGITIGRNDDMESYLYEDYHSMQLIDKEGNTYFHVSDLREHDGRITDEFIADGTQTDFYFSASINTRVDPNYEHVDITVDDVRPSNYSLSVDHIHFSTAPSANSIVKIKYFPATNFALDDAFFKAYTFGIRKTNQKIGAFSVAEGINNSAVGELSHAEGYNNQTNGNYSHAEGASNEANGIYSHVEGWQNKVTAAGQYAHAEGRGTTSSGAASHAEGAGSKASWNKAHAEGDHTEAAGDSCHSEGIYTYAGYNVDAAHAEGYYTRAGGDCSHAEGSNTKASNRAAHAEGVKSQATGTGAHAEGCRSLASGDYSHAQNYDTVASHDYQTVIGKLNEATVSGSGTDQSPYTYSNVPDYPFIIGNGTANTTADRSNAFIVDWNGNTGQQGRATTADMTTGSGGEVEDFLSELTISGAPLNTTQADWIIEEGTIDNWKYCKWESGMYECWGNIDLTSYTITTARGNLYTGDWVTINFPITFASVPTAVVTGFVNSDAYCLFPNIRDLTKPSMKIRMGAGASVSTNLTIRVNVYVKGKWQ